MPREAGLSLLLVLISFSFRGSWAVRDVLQRLLAQRVNSSQPVVCRTKTDQEWAGLPGGKDARCHSMLYRRSMSEVAGESGECFNTLAARNEARLVVSSAKEDLGWLQDLHWPMAIISHIIEDAPPEHASSLAALQAKTSGLITDTMPNRGREGGAYLKYIVDNYDSLPPVNVFVHPHPSSWHSGIAQGRLLDNLRIPADLKYRTINSCDYGSKSAHGLQCSNLKTGEGDAVRMGVLKKYWSELFEERYGKLEQQGDTWCLACCAQFVASRQAIHQHPKEFYTKLYDAVMKEEGRDRQSMWCFEFFWTHLLDPDTAFPQRQKPAMDALRP